MPKTEPGKIRAVLKSEIGVIVVAASMAISIVLFIVVPQYQSRQDIAIILEKIDVIKTNHLVHIQTAIDEGRAKDDQLEESINTININIAEIKTLISSTH